MFEYYTEVVRVGAFREELQALLTRLSAERYSEPTLAFTYPYVLIVAKRYVDAQRKEIEDWDAESCHLKDCPACARRQNAEALVDKAIARQEIVSAMQQAAQPVSEYADGSPTREILPHTAQGD